MNHADCQELLPLELYGELDSAERSRLQEHLARCESCTAFQVELRAVLGSLPRGEVPAGWGARLDRAVALEARSIARWRRLRIAATAAAGFAAGVLLTATLRSGAPSTGPGAELEASTGFTRSTPPPPAQSAGALTQWGSYLGR